MNYFVDYHIHSTHSTDGASSIMEICQGAVNRGIQEIVITDHFEPMLGDEFYPIYDQKSYWADINKAKQGFKGKVKLKMGVELGQPNYFQAGAAKIMKDFPYDYVIASAHKLENGKDMSEMDYANIAVEDICSLYLKQLEKLLEWADFDCVGHLDLIKRYSAKVYGKNLTLNCQHELLTEVLNKIITAGKGIEINTSGLRQAPKETLPGLDVLTLYNKLGGELLTIGSDAHRAEDVGKGVQEAFKMAEMSGFRYITTYNARKPEQIKISQTKAFSVSQR